MNYLKNLLCTILLLTLSTCGSMGQQVTDPLPSWKDGAAKQAILEFVRNTTDKASAGFVPPEERIATFDQDGTLWVEQPIYTQIRYCLDRIPAVVAAKPELKDVEPFKTVLSGNRELIAKLPMSALEKIAIVTLTGMSTEQFQEEVKAWLAVAKDSRWKRPYTELTYQPMQEVLKFLRANDYKTYIATGGGQDFVRVFAEKTYGIPPEQVVGSAGGIKYGYDASGRPILTKEPTILLNDNHAGKPEGIHLIIGRRPHVAFGNSTGDQQMLEYTKAGTGPRLSLLVLHDDAEREYAYGPAQGLPNSSVGTFTQELYDEAKKDGWIVISMKNDWKRIFAFDEESKPTQPAEQVPVTAIDITLEPDATMIQHATAANARLLKVFSKGFTLDATHSPHITLLQRYVRTSELDKVYDAVGKVLTAEKPTEWRLKAYSYYYLPLQETGLAGIVVEPTDDLLRLQKKLIEAVAPFAEKNGTAKAFVTTPEDPEINQPTIDYIAQFVPSATGKNFNPHVTIGIASQDYLNKMLAEPFDGFTFSPAGTSIYQLGNFGTARKMLKTWQIKQ